MMATVGNSSEGLLQCLKEKILVLFGIMGRCLFKTIRLAFCFSTNLCKQVFLIERAFLKLTHVFSFICQTLFLNLCEAAFVNHQNHKENVESGLVTLLFYSIFGYFVSQIKDIYLRDWQGRRRMNTLYRRHMWWIYKIGMEWLKAVIAVVCIHEQGMKYRVNLWYNLVTFAYFVCTEKILSEMVQSAVSYFNFDLFDSLEYLYVPIFMHVYTISASSFLAVYLYNTKYAQYTLVSSYFTVYLQLKHVVYNYVNPLKMEKQMYASFKMATSKDIEKWDDVCAICLNNMSKARITPCKHLFHPQCLKRCLKESYQCPLCKQDLPQ